MTSMKARKMEVRNTCIRKIMLKKYSIAGLRLLQKTLHHN